MLFFPLWRSSSVGTENVLKRKKHYRYNKLTMVHTKYEDLLEATGDELAAQYHMRMLGSYRISSRG